MFDNLLIIAAIIIVAWLGIFIYYMVTSQQQIQLQDEIEEVDELLDGPTSDNDDAAKDTY